MSFKIFRNTTFEVSPSSALNPLANVLVSIASQVSSTKLQEMVKKEARPRVFIFPLVFLMLFYLLFFPSKKTLSKGRVKLSRVQETSPTYSIDPDELVSLCEAWWFWEGPEVSERQRISTGPARWQAAEWSPAAKLLEANLLVRFIEGDWYHLGDDCNDSTWYYYLDYTTVIIIQIHHLPRSSCLGSFKKAGFDMLSPAYPGRHPQ